MLEGDITVTSELGLGSCFTIILPLTLSEKEQKIVPASNQHEEKECSSSANESLIPTWSSETKILLVEDNRINQVVARQMLKHFNLSCDIANNVSEALA